MKSLYSFIVESKSIDVDGFDNFDENKYYAIFYMVHHGLNFLEAIYNKGYDDENELKFDIQEESKKSHKTKLYYKEDGDRYFLETIKGTELLKFHQTSCGEVATSLENLFKYL